MAIFQDMLQLDIKKCELELQLEEQEKGLEAGRERIRKVPSTAWMLEEQETERKRDRERRRKSPTTAEMLFPDNKSAYNFTETRSPEESEGSESYRGKPEKTPGTRCRWRYSNLCDPTRYHTQVQ